MNAKERRERQVRRLAELLDGGSTVSGAAEAMDISRSTANRLLADARKLIEEGLVSSRPAPAAAGGLDELQSQALKEVGLGPQTSMVLTKKLKAKLIRALENDKVDVKTASATLNTLEAIRRSAEGGIAQRAEMLRDVADELIRVADGVLSDTAWKDLKKALEGAS